MEKATKDSCSLKDIDHSHGSEVCTDGKCMICNHGKWEDSMEMFPPEKPSEPFSPTFHTE